MPVHFTTSNYTACRPDGRGNRRPSIKWDYCSVEKISHLQFVMAVTLDADLIHRVGAYPTV